MSEKKHTVRKVIASGVVQAHDTSYFQACDIKIEDTPIGTPIEIVANVPVERKLIRGSARWYKSEVSPYRWNLLLPTGEIANVVKVHEGQSYWYVKDKCDGASTLEAAQIAAEHELADRGVYGFGWEAGLPEYECYQVRYYEKFGYRSLGTLFEGYEAANKNYCQREDAWMLYGYHADGSVDILARKDGES